MTRSTAISRRTLAKGVAWSIPTIAIAASAPASAVSGGEVPPEHCIPQPYKLDWGRVTYTNRDQYSGVAVVPPTTGTSDPITMTLSASFVGNMQPGSEAGARGNLALSSSAVGGTGKRGLRLYQSLKHSRGSAPVGGRAQAQLLSVTFSQPVTNLSFTITDIDSNSGDFWDAVELTSGSAFTATRTAGIVGAGSGASPWYRDNSNAPVDDTSGLGNVAVRFAGPVSSLQIRYWNGASDLGRLDTDQGIYLAGFDFSATPKDC